MIFQTRQFIRNKNNSKAIFLKSILLLVVFLFFGFVGRFFFINFFSPIYASGNSFYSSLFVLAKIFTSKEDLIEENRLLNEKINQIEISILDSQFLKSENERLNNELGFKNNSNSIVARVISKPPQTTVDTLIIDIGSYDGISLNDPVLVGENIFIGKVQNVFKNQSVVVLNSFAGVLSYGYVMRTGEFLEVEGIGGGNMHAKIPIDFDIEIGDKVDIDSSKTYLFALVSSVEENKASGFKDVLLSLPVNVSKQRMVSVEKSE